MKKITRNQNADPVLAGLANRLNGDILFTDLAPLLCDKMPGVSWCSVRKMYRVRMCLGGVNRVLGVTPSVAAACRYADACRLFFWPYKIRAGRAPADTDFIYDRSTTESDLANNPALASTLQAILTHLQRTGGVPVVEEGKARAKEARQTARSELRDYLADRADAEDQLRKEMKQSFSEVLERLRTLDKRVDELSHQTKWKWHTPPPAPAWEAPHYVDYTQQPTCEDITTVWYSSAPPPAGENDQPWYNPVTAELKVQQADGTWVVQDYPAARACPGGVNDAGHPSCGKTPCECTEAPTTNLVGRCKSCDTLPCQCGPVPHFNQCDRCGQSICTCP